MSRSEPEVFLAASPLVQCQRPSAAISIRRARKTSGTQGTIHPALEKFEDDILTIKISQMFSVHTTPHKFDNHDFTLKRIKCNLPTLRRKNLKTRQSPVILDLCLKKNSGREHDHKIAVTTTLSKKFCFKRFPYTLKYT